MASFVKGIFNRFLAIHYIYKSNKMDQYMLNSNVENRIVNYQRYMPEFSVDTLFALLLIIFGIALVLGLKWRAKYKKINK